MGQEDGTLGGRTLGLALAHQSEPAGGWGCCWEQQVLFVAVCTLLSTSQTRGGFYQPNNDVPRVCQRNVARVLSC